MKPTRILLADDHAVVIEGLRRILDRPEFEVVGTVADGQALVREADRLRPDVIVTDITMPLLNGIDAARQILARGGAPKIIFLTMHPEVAYASAAIASGACAYVVKSAAGQELVDAIQHALSGRVYMSPAVEKALGLAKETPLRKTRGAVDGLTDRQREVLQLLAQGLQVKEIAAKLNVSPRTVEFHKYRIMELLGVRTVAELTRYAVTHGIVT